ncbi:kinesin-like protein KIF19, partial [Pteropus vampyrus]|uniref:Kinesin-like protein n=1 Tax=Pteropus vampyrus TaxID=132908 RepID=A0A6P3QBX5_PTEVA
MKDSGDSKDQQLMVALRVRPISVAELEEGATLIAHKVDEQMVVLMDPMEDPDDILRAHRSREKSYLFDVAFDFTATQEMVYQATTKSLIKGVISGYNATVFAYGPTGCGKTYTMLGTDREPGIYVRTLDDLFRAIEETSSDMEYEVSMSYLEIYNEMIRDLLNPALGYLELREDAKGVIQVAGITEVSTINAKEIMQLLVKGNRQRTQEPTAANRTSSRSHAVLQVAVRQRSRVKSILQEVRQGRLFMIDLAGSERASQTQNRGQRMKEGAHINRSLLALGNCINALSDKTSNKYINYRDSKLTRLLKDSLGGNSRTVMIAHISPASSAFEESRNTLTYAGRAKNIKTRVKQNLLSVSYHIAQYTSIIADLRGEIQRLKCKIDEQGGRGQARGRLERGDIRHIQAEVQQHSGRDEQADMGHLREQLVSAFQEQVDVRRCLLELENLAMEVQIDTESSLPKITPAVATLTPESDQESVKTLSSEAQHLQNSLLPPLSTESEAKRMFKASPRAWQVKSSSVPTPPPIQIGSLVTQEAPTQDSLVSLSSRITSSPDSSENLSEVPLSHKERKEILTGTKCISVKAARRRTRALGTEGRHLLAPAAERSSLSLHSLSEADDSRAPGPLACKRPPSPTLQHAASEDNLSSSTGEAPSRVVGPRGDGAGPWPRGQRKSLGKKREESLEAKRRKRRSRSFEVTGQGLTRPKTHLLGPRPMESISDHRMPVCGHPAPGIRHLGKVTLPLAKVKLPPSRSAGPGDSSPLAVPSNPAGVSRRATRGPRLPHGASTHGKDGRF